LDQGEIVVHFDGEKSVREGFEPLRFVEQVRREHRVIKRLRLQAESPQRTEIADGVVHVTVLVEQEPVQRVVFAGRAGEEVGAAVAEREALGLFDGAFEVEADPSGSSHCNGKGRSSRVRSVTYILSTEIGTLNMMYLTFAPQPSCDRRDVGPEPALVNFRLSQRRRRVVAGNYRHVAGSLPATSP
jgi:hypothetical protein